MFKRSPIALLIFFLAPLPAVGQEPTLDAEDLFAPNQIVDVRIDLPEESWEQICSQSRSFSDSLRLELAESPFTNFKADVTVNGVKIKDVAVRKKGFLGSLDTRRPSLKIKFDEFIDQDPIKGIDRLTLNNNKQDPGRMSQYLSYRMYNKSGTEAPRCSFAKVTVNGDYLGIYSNVESVRKPFLKSRFGSSKGSLFEGTVTDFYDRWIPRFEPKTKKSDRAPLAQVAEIMDAEEIDLQELEKRIDLPAFMRFWAMESLIGFWDGYCNNQNNYFIYQKPENDKLYFIPWGTDSSYAKTMPLPPYRVRPRSVHSKAILPNRLYRTPETQAMYQKTLFELIDKHWDETELIAEIDELEKLLEDEVMDSNRGFARGVRNYRRFVNTRRDEIMEEFEDGPPELQSKHKLPVFFDQVGSAQVKFSTEWTNARAGGNKTESEVELTLMLDGKPLKLEEVGAYVGPNRSPGSRNETSIVVFGKRPSDGKQLTLVANLPNPDYQSSSEESRRVNGVYMVNNNFMANGKWTLVSGTAKLDETGNEEGQPVSGSLDLQILRLTDDELPEK